MSARFFRKHGLWVLLLMMPLLVWLFHTLLFFLPAEWHWTNPGIRNPASRPMSTRMAISLVLGTFGSFFATGFLSAIGPPKSRPAKAKQKRDTVPLKWYFGLPHRPLHLLHMYFVMIAAAFLLVPASRLVAELAGWDARDLGGLSLLIWFALIVFLLHVVPTTWGILRVIRDRSSKSGNRIGR